MSAVHSVIETGVFIIQADDAGVSEDERAHIVSLIAGNPQMGESLGAGLRKARVAGRGKGKSGGYRVITFYSDAEHPAFLLALFGKGEKANLTSAELNALKKLAVRLIDSLKSKVSPLRKTK